MRRKRMDDLQTVMDQVNVLQSENDDLRATQRRYAIQTTAGHAVPCTRWWGPGGGLLCDRESCGSSQALQEDLRPHV